MVGLIVFSIATLTFGLASYSSNTSVFYGISFLARLLQGIADALMNVTLPAILVIEFADK